MTIQKPTTLDAARISGELSGLQNSIINSVWIAPSGKSAVLELVRPKLIIRYAVESRYACLGITSQIPSDLIPTFPNLKGQIIKSAEQVNYDRIVKLILEKRDRLGRPTQSAIIFEIIPNIGNLYLVNDDGNIQGMLRKKDITHYDPPAAVKKPTIFNFNGDLIAGLIADGKKPHREIMGLNERDAINLGLDSDRIPENIDSLLSGYRDKAARPGPAWIITRNNQISGYSLVDPVLKPGELAEIFESALIMYERYYKQTACDGESTDRLDSLLKILDNEINKTGRKAESIGKELIETANAERYKIYGELILSNISLIERGASKVKLKNTYGISKTGDSFQEYFEIELDPAKSPAANAEVYFRKFKKAVSGRSVMERRLEKAKKKLKELEDLKREAGNDQDKLSDGLLRHKLIAEKKSALKRKPVEKRKPYKLFKASCGWDILVGKSNKDNDELTLKIASGDDYWFHAWQAAGSHTVLKVPSRNAVPEKQTLLEAAALAAYFSKARNSSKVAVVYTQARYVRKPKKFAPGKVLVEREKQLMVKPANPADYQIDETSE